jgi:hypothetical protein
MVFSIFLVNAAAKYGYNNMVKKITALSILATHAIEQTPYQFRGIYLISRPKVSEVFIILLQLLKNNENIL